MENNKFLNLIKKTMVISCQAVGDEPLNVPKTLALMAKACVQGGSKALRVSQVESIKAIQKAVDVPLIGLIKETYEGSDVYITPTLKEVKQLLNLEVQVIAIDATIRKRPKETLKEMVEYIRKVKPNQLIMADCATELDMINAYELGFDIISSTLRGYTKETKGHNNLENNFAFIKWATKKLPDAKIVLEGGIWDPITAKKALATNAFCIVVGSAITRPLEIAKHYYKIIGEK